MDKDLKAAIEKGKLIKESKQLEEEKAAQKRYDEHRKYIESQLIAANKWIKEVLFAKIAKEEASEHPHRSIYLGTDNVNGISVEAIFTAAKEIKGLKPTYTCPPIYENAEFVGCGDAQYSIGWEAEDNK